MEQFTPVKSVLFVCLGNICRSPTAEGVFATKAKEAGLKLKVDSAGTAGYHVGAPPDRRSQDVAKNAGYDLSKLKCRRVNENDFRDFDLIVPMDLDNERKLIEKCPDEFLHKIQLMMSFTNSDFEEVPDPYYSGIKGFELVLNLIEQASDGLINRIQ